MMSDRKSNLKQPLSKDGCVNKKNNACIQSDEQEESASNKTNVAVIKPTKTLDHHNMSIDSGIVPEMPPCYRQLEDEVFLDKDGMPTTRKLECAKTVAKVESWLKGILTPPNSTPKLADKKVTFSEQDNYESCDEFSETESSGEVGSVSDNSPVRLAVEDKNSYHSENWTMPHTMQKDLWTPTRNLSVNSKDRNTDNKSLSTGGERTIQTFNKPDYEETAKMPGNKSPANMTACLNDQSKIPCGKTGRLQNNSVPANISVGKLPYPFPVKCDQNALTATVNENDVGGFSRSDTNSVLNQTSAPLPQTPQNLFIPNNSQFYFGGPNSIATGPPNINNSNHNVSFTPSIGIQPFGLHGPPFIHFPPGCYFQPPLPPKDQLPPLPDHPPEDEVVKEISKKSKKKLKKKMRRNQVEFSLKMDDPVTKVVLELSMHKLEKQQADANPPTAIQEPTQQNLAPPINPTLICNYKWNTEPKRFEPEPPTNLNYGYHQWDGRPGNCIPSLLDDIPSVMSPHRPHPYDTENYNAQVMHFPIKRQHIDHNETGVIQRHEGMMNIGGRKRTLLRQPYRHDQDNKLPRQPTEWNTNYDTSIPKRQKEYKEPYEFHTGSSQCGMLDTYEFPIPGNNTCMKPYPNFHQKERTEYPNTSSEHDRRCPMDNIQKKLMRLSNVDVGAAPFHPQRWKRPPLQPKIHRPMKKIGIKQRSTRETLGMTEDCCVKNIGIKHEQSNSTKTPAIAEGRPMKENISLDQDLAEFFAEQDFINPEPTVGVISSPCGKESGLTKN